MQTSNLPRFNESSTAVIRLIHSLPREEKQFIIFMDNYFTKVPLFAHLWRLGISAVGTTRKNYRGFPKELKALSNELKISDQYLWNSMISQGIRDE